MNKPQLFLACAVLTVSQAFTSSAPANARFDSGTAAPAASTLAISSFPGEGRIEPTARTPVADDDGRHLYLVRFREASLALYAGDIAGLPATRVRSTGARKLDVRSPAARAYLGYLTQRQNGHLQTLSTLLQRPLEPVHRYRNILNAVAVPLTVDEAHQVAALDNVRSVFVDEEMQPDTDVGPGWIGAPAIWNGETTSGTGNRGEGVIVGIIDSGVQHAHPSFAATASDGYVHVNPYGSGVFVGVCASTPGLCNDKLIGSYVFNGSTPEDESQHGTHVASTAIGNPLDANFRGLTIPISGVAPRANVINYKVCSPGCPQTASAAAVEQAIDDGTDVLNYSISGSDNPWNTIIDVAFLEGNEAGLSIAVSAGNTGPNPATTTKTGAWVAGFANYSHDRIIGNAVDAAGLTGLMSVFGAGPALASDLNAPILDAASVAPDNELGCTAFPAGSFTGAVALIQRGGCTFAIKASNAAAAGAVFLLLFNNQGGPPSVPGGLDGSMIPASMIDLADGLALRQAIADSSDPQATVHADASIDQRPAWGNVTANLSGRGPSQFDVLKPDFAAPGTNILAAGLAANGNFAMIGGTSMASPHGAGAMALLIGQHDDWSPAQVKSAMALTASNEGLLKQDGETAADAFDHGSGMVDLAGAGSVGFVLDEMHANFAAANPAIGGDPRTLNLATLQDRACPGQCTWQRTITSVLATATNYSVGTSATDGLSIVVTPAEFTLEPGAEQTLSIAIDVSALPLDVWQFAHIEIEADSAVVADKRIAVAVRGVPEPEAPQIEIEPKALSATLDAGDGTTQFLSIANLGEQTLDWSIGFGVDVEPAPLPTLAPILAAGDAWLDPDDEQVGLDRSLTEIEPAQPRLLGQARRGALAQGLLLTPASNSGAQRVLAFDPYSGDLVDENFITYVRPDPNTNLATPKHVILNAAGDGFLIVDQIRHVVSAYDLDGNHQGVFAPAGGVDTSVAQNMRSIVYAPNGELLASVGAGANGDAVAGFDAAGLYQGNYIDNGANGLASPWDVVFRADDLLVSASQTGGAGVTTSIFRFNHDGSPAGSFADNVRFVQQISETGSGTVLAAHAFTTTGAPPAGVLEFSADGELLASWPFDSPRGVIELGNGNLLVSNGSGVHEIDRSGGLVETKISGVSTHHITLARLGAGCDGMAPAWLSVNPEAGSVVGGGSTEVEVSFDSTGLAGGSYSTRLCIESNDPARPVVEVPVELTVIADDEGADLALNLFGVPDTVAAGGELRILAAVANFGPDTASEVVIELVLPDAFTFVSGRRIEGAGAWQCSALDTLVTCAMTAGELPAASLAAVLEVRVAVAADAEEGTVQTEGVVEAIGGSDPDPDNNAATLTTTILAGTPDRIFGNGFECATGLPGC